MGVLDVLRTIEETTTYDDVLADTRQVSRRESNFEQTHDFQLFRFRFG